MQLFPGEQVPGAKNSVEKVSPSLTPSITGLNGNIILIVVVLVVGEDERVIS